MIVLDTNAVIAAFQLNPPGHLAPFRLRVREAIADAGGRAAIPAIVLAECYFKLDSSERQREFGALLERRVPVFGFDENCAHVAATIGRAFCAGHPLSAVVKDYGGRDIFKADLLILATAKGHRITKLITGDKRIRPLAALAGIEVVLFTEAAEPPPAPRDRLF